MKNRRVLISGATGFVGASLVRYFAASGANVLATGRGPAPEQLHRYARYVENDLQKGFPRHEVDVVIHAAARANDRGSREDFRNANLYGTQNLYRATETADTWVYISTSSVYDDLQTEHYEQEPVNLDRLSEYGRSKREAENWLLQRKRENQRLVILRPRAIYGPGDRVLLPRLLRLVKGKYLLSPGDLQVKCSMTHIENLCVAVDQSCSTDTIIGKEGNVFNVADRETYVLREVLGTLLPAVCGLELRIVTLNLEMLKKITRFAAHAGIPFPVSPMALDSVSRGNILNTDLIAERFGYQPERNFRNSLTAVIEWTRLCGLSRVRYADPNLPWMVKN